MAASSWSKMMILVVKVRDHNFGRCLFFHPLMGAMGSSVTSASTRLVADGGGDELGFDGHPEGLDPKETDQKGQTRPT